jgi:hypothetical protein
MLQGMLVVQWVAGSARVGVKLSPALFRHQPALSLLISTMSAPWLLVTMTRLLDARQRCLPLYLGRNARSRRCGRMNPRHPARVHHRGHGDLPQHLTHRPPTAAAYLTHEPLSCLWVYLGWASQLSPSWLRRLANDASSTSKICSTKRRGDR